MSNIEQLGSHMNNMHVHVEQLRSHTTNIAHYWSHVMNIAYFSSMSSYTTNTAPLLCFVFIWTTISAGFVNASGLVGEGTRLSLPRLDGF